MFSFLTPLLSTSVKPLGFLFSPQPKKRLLALGSAVSMAVTLPAWTPKVFAQTPLNPDIKVGIVQRFGEEKADKLTIEAMPGDELTLSFRSNGEVQTVTTSKVEFDIQMKPLAEPRRDSRVVVSTHRSFESAEAKANQLRAQGIQVELAQPNKWQVWGKRDLYVTDQNQIWLLNQVKQRGFPNAFIDKKTFTQKPQLSWTASGFRYHRDAVSIDSGTKQFKVNKDRFAGRLYFQTNAYGNYTLVNETPIETYLRGVVPYEIGPKAPPTAVQAQSIIARTYALRNLRRFKVDNYELCATTQCQVYRGLDASTPYVDKAISATTGKVLTYNNELVDALYSSQTGGVTAQFEDVWEGQARPYLRSRIDAAPNQVWNLDNKPLSDENNFRQFIGLTKGFNEETWSSFRWKRDSSIKEINQNLRRFLKAEQNPLASFGSVQNIVVARRSKGGRVQQLRVMTDMGEVLLQKDEILRAFDAPNSLLFYVQPKSKSVPVENASSTTPEPGAVAATKQVLEGFSFVGGGLGHAVGLSQAGSYRLSDIGYSAEQILNFYYPGASLQPLTSSIVYWKDSQPTAVAATPTAQASPVPAQPIQTQPVAQASPAPQPEEEGPEILGVKLPKVRFNVLWDWLPFF